MALGELDKRAWRRGRVSKRSLRAPGPTLLVLLFDALLLCSTLGVARADSALVQLCAVPMLLVVLLHGYLVLHECAHGSVFAAGRCNEVLGHVLGFVILCPFLSRRRSHALHHKWTGHPELDPTNARAVQRLSRLSVRELVLLDLMWRAYVPFLAFFEIVGLFVQPFGSDRDRPGAAAERRATVGYVVGYAAVLGCLVWFGHVADAVTLYAPAWVLLLVLTEIINLPHHLEAPLTRERLALWEQGRVTHSCASVPVWSRLVLLNFNLHEPHHLWPTYAWHELPAAHRALAKLTEPSMVCNELAWSVRQRRRPFASVMSQYIVPPQDRVRAAPQ